VVAAVPVSVFVVWLVVGHHPPAGPPRLGDGHDPASYGFDLSPSLIGDGQLVATGIPRDGLPTLVEPDVVAGGAVAALNEAQRGKFLVDSDRVAALEIAGEARAWPLRLLRWHEVVNDTLGGVPIVVTYSPLCDALVIADRRLEGQDTSLELASSGLLIDSNPLLFDRRVTPQDSSLWRQLDMEAVSGPLEGTRLRILAARLTTWGEWFAAHPETTVLAPQPGMEQKYSRDPYHSYFGSDLLHFPVAPLPLDDGLGLKDRLVIVGSGDETETLALPRLAQAVGSADGTWSGRIGGHPVRIRFQRDAGTAVVEELDGSSDGPAVRYAFRFAWFAAHTDGAPPGP
jgi:hypothetical protein